MNEMLSESKWTILKGEDQNNIMFVRRNESAKRLIGHPDYVYRVGVAILLLYPGPNGLPTDEEAKILHSIEDSLVKEIQANQDGLLVLVITTGGIREFVFYSRNPGDVKQLISTLQIKHESHKLQFYVTKDSDWEIYKEYS